MTTALAIIEEVYNMVLNPNEDYYAQLLPLASNGELANHANTLQVLCKLALLVDKQGTEIQNLKEKYVDNSQSSETIPTSLDTSEPVVTDPTKPL